MAEQVETEPTRVMLAVNESSIKGYPNPSISSKGAFEWTLDKIVRSNTAGFKLLFLHVQVPDEDGAARVRQGFSNRSSAPTTKRSPAPASKPKVPHGFEDMDSVYASPDDFKDLREKNKAKGVHLLEYFITKCHEIGVMCEGWVKTGDPNQVICREVVRVRPDLLVLGCRGLGPFQRVFVGTVSEFCQKHAECPVIVIKRKQDEMPQDPVDD